MPMAVYGVGRREIGTLPALGASILVAFNHALIANSTRGLREEAYSVLLLLFLLFIAGAEKGNLKSVVVAGIFSALAILTKIEFIVIFLPVFCYLILKYRSLKRGFFWPAILLAMTFVPFLAFYSWEIGVFGTYLPITAAAWNPEPKNPGYLLMASLAGYRTIEDYVALVLLGLGNVWKYMLEEVFPAGSVWLVILGFVVLFLRRRALYLHITGLSSLLFGSFLNGIIFVFWKIVGPLDTFRYLFPYVPLGYLALCYSFAWLNSLAVAGKIVPSWWRTLLVFRVPGDTSLDLKILVPAVAYFVYLVVLVYQNLWYFGY
jgi:hypothetical protein